MNEQFKGTGVALVTPFLTDKRIDFDALTRLINNVIGGGIDFIVSLGTTGEVATLSLEEQKQVVQHTLKIVDERVPVMIGCGGNNTKAVAETMIEMETWGTFDCFLSVSPYYSKPSQDGIYHHYKYLAEHTNKDILLYNVPGRTARNVEVKTICKLAKDFNNIIGIKEAGGSLKQSEELIQCAPEDFIILSGDDDLIVQQMQLGFQGTISVVANAYPNQWSEIIKTLRNKETTRPQEVFDGLFQFVHLIFEENNPAGIKCALNEMNFIQNECRLPIVPVSETLDKRIREFVANY